MTQFFITTLQAIKIQYEILPAKAR
jgi:hypothetical protein